MTQIKSHDIVAAFIILLGLCLRVAGVQFGLPDLFHADEPIVVNHALAFSSWDFNPHFFRIPPLTSYLLFGFYGVSFVVGKVMGVWEGITAFEHLFYADPTFFYLSGRLVFGVLLGTLSLIVFYLGIRKQFSGQTVLFALLAFATCFVRVRDSHYIYADIPLVLIITLFFNELFLLHVHSSYKSLAKLGILIGLAGAFKYNGVFLAIPFLMYSFWMRSRKGIIKDWFLVGFISLITFLVLNPFSLIDYKYFIEELRGEAMAHTSGVDWLHHMTYSLREGIGWPALLFCYYVTIIAILRFNKQALSAILFIICYYIVLWKMGQPYGRYVLPLIPPIMYLLAYGFENLFLGAEKKNRSWLIAILILIPIVLPNSLKALQFDILMGRKDTRTLAKEWIEEKIPGGARIALDSKFYMPRLHVSEPQLLEKRQLASQTDHFSGAQRKKIDYLLEEGEEPNYNLYYLKNDVMEDAPLFDLPKLPYDIEALNEAGIRYVVLSIRQKVDLYSLFRKSLMKQGKLMKRFTPYRNSEIEYPIRDPLTGGPLMSEDIFKRTRNGQILEIYKIGS